MNFSVRLGAMARNKSNIIPMQVSTYIVSNCVTAYTTKSATA